MSNRSRMLTGAGAHADRLALARREEARVAAWVDCVFVHLMRGDGLVEAWRKANEWEVEQMPTLRAAR